jgi:hypothetical protein
MPLTVQAEGADVAYSRRLPQPRTLTLQLTARASADTAQLKSCTLALVFSMLVSPAEQHKFIL